jgi:hypothetical protein
MPAKSTAVRKTKKTDEVATQPAVTVAPESAPVAAPSKGPVKTTPKVVAAAPAPAPTAAPAAKAAPVAKATPVKVTVKAVEPQPEQVAEAEPAPEGEKKQRRKRPPVRSFEEIAPEIDERLSLAYKSLQEARKLWSQALTSHKRAVSSGKQTQNVTRTPTILFDQELVDYFLARLDPSERVVSRRVDNEKVDVSLADLSTTTRLHRTDVTRLFAAAFRKHNMLDAKDKRYILYQNDPELVHLLTTGDIDLTKYQTVVDSIADGSYRLSIFNIQKVISQHLGKVDTTHDQEHEEAEHPDEA